VIFEFEFWILSLMYMDRWALQTHARCIALVGRAMFGAANDAFKSCPIESWRCRLKLE